MVEHAKKNAKKETKEFSKYWVYLTDVVVQVSTDLREGKIALPKGMKRPIDYAKLIIENEYNVLRVDDHKGDIMYLVEDK